MVGKCQSDLTEHEVHGGSIECISTTSEASASLATGIFSAICTQPNDPGKRRSSSIQLLSTAIRPRVGPADDCREAGDTRAPRVLPGGAGHWHVGHTAAQRRRSGLDAAAESWTRLPSIQYPPARAAATVLALRVRTRSCRSPQQLLRRLRSPSCSSSSP